jgi:hypothetical protein
MVWVIENNFGQAISDPFQPPTPENDENVNVFLTGPDFEFWFGSNSAVRVFGRWGDMYYQTSPYDNQRWLGGASYVRQTSAGAALSLSATAARVDYDDLSQASSYDLQEYSINYIAEGARTNILAELGYRSLNDYGSTTGGPLVRVDLTRKLSDYSELQLVLGSVYGDTGSLLQNFGDTNTPTDPNSGQIVAAGSVAQQDYADLTWTMSRQRTNLWLRAGYQDYDYEKDSDLSYNWVSLGAGASRKVRETFRVGARISWNDYTYDKPESDYDQIDASASLRWQPARAFYTDLQVRYFSRSSESELNQYDETQVWFWIGWAPKDR